eukprot:921339-Pelagomonas_calceolata.AAC.5
MARDASAECLGRQWHFLAVAWPLWGTLQAVCIGIGRFKPRYKPRYKALNVCVRRGEYDPNPQLVSVSQDPQLAGGSGSPSGGAQERGALHNHAGRHSASLSSQQQQQQQQQQDLLPPHPVQSTPRCVFSSLWRLPG